MYINRLFLAASALLLGASSPALAAPVEVESDAPVVLDKRSAILLPADDPFYSPPSGYENEAPGTVLRSRSIIASFFSLIPDPVESWQLLYRTTAVNGTPIATVTTIFKPTGAMTDRFVSYASAYDSSASKCDPSYDYQLGSDSADGLETEAEFLLIQGYLLQGYIVSSPNYEGPDTAFAPGHLEGMGVLDSLRAVSNFHETLGLSTDKPDIVATGYSGGAIATGWAASLQNSYAPELPVKGWVHGGTPVNLTAIMLYIANTTWSGFLPAAVAGLSAPSAYQAQLQPVLDQVLTTDGKEAIEYVTTNCMQDDLLKYAFTSILSYEFQTLGPALLQNSAVSSVLDDCIMGSTNDLTPIAPSLIYHARQDEIIPYANASALVDRYCSRGADVTFTTFEQGGHATTLLLATPEVFKFVKNAFEGNTPKGCSDNSELGTGLDILGDLIGLAVELEPIASHLIDLLHSIATSL